ncbi:hypothetical protein FRX31_033860 [Thalictrum thalictroides]|uniref:Uncharacterized protein n=1 Tax=Thalictrum thalictroides TaxID=46969 RepID=A0A7J6UVQ3_THATH|nr:hypothetical protein FRX31_033860 [Thalictrum thalictroides]
MSIPFIPFWWVSDSEDWTIDDDQIQASKMENVTSNVLSMFVCAYAKMHLIYCSDQNGKQAGGFCVV